jgi:hypothetical protein
MQSKSSNTPPSAVDLPETGGGEFEELELDNPNDVAPEASSNRVLYLAHLSLMATEILALLMSEDLLSFLRGLLQEIYEWTVDNVLG